MLMSRGRDLNPGPLAFHSDNKAVIFQYSSETREVLGSIPIGGIKIFRGFELTTCGLSESRRSWVRFPQGTSGFSTDFFCMYGTVLIKSIELSNSIIWTSHKHSTGRTILYLQPINKLTSQCEIRTLWTELTTNNWDLSFDMSTGMGTLTEVRHLELDNVKYARGHNQYIFTPYQLNQGREFMHTSYKALTSVKGCDIPRVIPVTDYQVLQIAIILSSTSYATQYIGMIYMVQMWIYGPFLSPFVLILKAYWLWTCSAIYFWFNAWNNAIINQHFSSR